MRKYKMREPKIPNRYNLTVPMISKLIPNREKIQQAPFWRNDVIGAWCLSDNTCTCGEDSQYGTYDEYWLGVYDEDAKAYAGKIRVTFSAYGGMCGYNFKQFYRQSDIENEMDLHVQELFLERMNELIDAGVFTLPEKEEA